jgi:MFS family permease
MSADERKVAVKATGGPLHPRRLPFYYGWVIVAIAFVTMGIAVSVRTAFSLLFPPILDEFGWDRGLAAGAFSFGFLVSAVFSPAVGLLMDRLGPKFVIEMGVVLMTAGLLLATAIEKPWQLYLSLGLLVGAGANCMSYTAQSLFLPNWFVRRRGLALGIAFSGVGVGALLLLPWLQTVIQQQGWRASCWAMGILAIVVLGPINLLVWRRPQDVGLLPDGTASCDAGRQQQRASNVVDPAWAATEWTLRRAVLTSRFWWIAIGYFFALFAWYAVQVHQTKYLIEIGFGPMEAAWALGLVSVVGIPGQVALGALSDRIGREWVWTAGCLGFAVCYAALIGLEGNPTRILLYVMVASQGLLGYALTSVMGPIAAEIFEGPHYGAVFGTLTIALIGGGAAGPWATGVVHDLTGSYKLAFAGAIGCCAISAIAIWLAAPRKVRLVPGLVA